MAALRDREAEADVRLVIALSQLSPPCERSPRLGNGRGGPTAPYGANAVPLQVQPSMAAKAEAAI
jgi:hypothetical protein